MGAALSPRAGAPRSCAVASGRPTAEPDTDRAERSARLAPQPGAASGLARPLACTWPRAVVAPPRARLDLPPNITPARPQNHPQDPDQDAPHAHAAGARFAAPAPLASGASSLADGLPEPLGTAELSPVPPGRRGRDGGAVAAVAAAVGRAGSVAGSLPGGVAAQQRHLALLGPSRCGRGLGAQAVGGCSTQEWVRLAAAAAAAGWLAHAPALGAMHCPAPARRAFPRTLAAMCRQPPLPPLQTNRDDRPPGPRPPRSGSGAL